MPNLETLRPTANRLLVWLDPGLQTTPSGLILPPDSQQIRQHGTVLSVGPDVTLVHPGDKVLLPLHCGTKLADKQNTPVLLVFETDLLALLEPDDLAAFPALGDSVSVES